MSYYSCVLLALLLLNGISKSQASARDGSPVPKKNPRDVETVVKMKYLHPTRLDEFEMKVPELQATIREHHAHNSDLIDSDQSNDSIRNEITEYSAELTNKGDVFWTTWSDWKDCSLSCGGGVSSRSRRCMPRYPTSDIDLRCEGMSVEYRLCNKQECPDGSTDFRAKQCSAHNHELYFGTRHNWQSYTGPEGPTCELKCTPTDMSVYQTFGPVLDGTKCGNHGICITGECIYIGCDGVIGSNLRKDHCGVCNGDNSTCVLRYSVVDHFDDLSFGYHELAKIPKGATNVIVKDYNRNYLALFESEADSSSNPVLNGDYVVNFPGAYKASGSSVRYNRIEDKETIEIEGPTKKDLHLMMLTMQKRIQPLVEYEYWIPKSPNSSNGAFGTGRATIQLPLNQEDIIAQLNKVGLDIDDVKPKTSVLTTVPTTTTQETTTSAASQHSRDENVGKSRPLTRPQCNAYKRASGRKKQFCDSDFALQVRILHGHRPVFGQHKRYYVDVLHRYKSIVRLSRREYIWMSKTCFGKLRSNEVYFIMGGTRRRSAKSKTVKASNQISIRRRPEYALVGSSAVALRFPLKHHFRMAKSVRRIKCRKHRRSLTKHGRKKSNKGSAKLFK